MCLDCGWPFRGPRLVLPDPGILRLGAWSLQPLIRIRGPCLVQALAMIFNSRAMVASCCGVAWLTSNLNCFIYSFCCYGGLSFLYPDTTKRDIILSYIILDSLSSLTLGAWGLQLLYFRIILKWAKFFPTAIACIAPVITWPQVHTANSEYFQYGPGLKCGQTNIVLPQGQQTLLDKTTNYLLSYSTYIWHH